MTVRLLVLIACAALPVLGPGAARAQDSPTQRPRGAQEPIPRHEAASDSSQEGTAEEHAALGTTDELPVAITRVAPVYPRAARERHQQGTVVVTVTVRRDGSAAPPRVHRSVTGLDEAALAAVAAWTWRPGRHAGKPEDRELLVPVRFVLPADSTVDWRAERRVATALEADGQTAQAFDRYALAVRAMAADAAPESLDAVRRGAIRTRPRGTPRDGVRGDEPPVEALVHLVRGDSLSAVTTPEAQRAAAAEYERALAWAPWQTAWYLSLARVQARTGHREAAARALELHLLGDLPPAERARLRDLIARLHGGAPPPSR